MQAMQFRTGANPRATTAFSGFLLLGWEGTRGDRSHGLPFLWSLARAYWERSR